MWVDFEATTTSDFRHYLLAKAFITYYPLGCEPYITTTMSKSFSDVVNMFQNLCTQ